MDKLNKLTDELEELFQVGFLLFSIPTELFARPPQKPELSITEAL